MTTEKFPWLSHRTQTDADAVRVLVERIKPILAGRPPAVQGAALADCMAIWLAGHCVPNDAAATASLRDGLLSTQWGLVRQLTDINAKIMGTAP